MARIALDAMGGDNAPIETVAGAVLAAGRGVEVVLVGDKRLLEPELTKHQVEFEIVQADETIGMGDDAARALREKPDSSISVAARLVASGDVQGMVSAGSTGAAMAAAAIIVGRIKGVARPSIASIFPTPGSPTLVLDSGANPEVTEHHLLQFAIMGTVASQALLGVSSPRVALLSIGEEKGKGRAVDKSAYALLEGSGLNFVGNVEGRDVGTDRADVIVTDGFTGNVFLKTTEGTARLITEYVKEALGGISPEARDEALPALAEVARRLDYETYGGGHLLGVAGVVVIAHGSSSRTAIANALGMASEGAEQDIPARISAQLSE
ncbi:MAG: phosphate acyltransferase PlsX [Acidimicrobiia bacterium]|nr:phosphate acyltransferase PlsX [Acidimicrobiia bacterium]MDH3462349.1 phosphate acyltransferase PlsX [Acidimicrobiia bacterium]